MLEDNEISNLKTEGQEVYIEHDVDDSTEMTIQTRRTPIKALSVIDDEESGVSNRSGITFDGLNEFTAEDY